MTKDIDNDVIRRVRLIRKSNAQLIKEITEFATVLAEKGPYDAGRLAYDYSCEGHCHIWNPLMDTCSVIYANQILDFINDHVPSVGLTCLGEAGEESRHIYTASNGQIMYKWRWSGHH